MGKALGHDVLVSESATEYDEVRTTARSNATTVHFGRVFPLCVERNSELPPDERKYQGRAVYEGPFVSDQNPNAAVFEELASPASRMSVSKMIGSIGCQHG